MVEFLATLYDNGSQYSVIATARSALGNFVHIPGVPILANHPLVHKVLKGVYNIRPPAPWYIVIWDSDNLQYLDSLDNTSINFKLLTSKTTALLTILSGQRISTIHKFRLSHCCSGCLQLGKYTLETFKTR